ncbi:MAG: tetratricopeptide repeat protein [Alphaproteobacteria bacterium]|nr:tetratricopeptide repeat protein [Alphaproteobacteria bacterium]
MRRLTFVLALLLAAAATPSAAGDFENGLAAYNRGAYSAALDHWRGLARKGHAAAQFNLGLMHDLGQGVARDYAAAARWYRKAADQGFASAQNNLGFLYAKGLGVNRDYPESAKWYRKAAEQGNVAAQFSLGLLYAKGLGLVQDHREAARWYRRAAERGHANAQINLAALYQSGRGVPQDHAEAAKWYRRAALEKRVGSKNIPVPAAVEPRGYVVAREGEQRRLSRVGRGTATPLARARSSAGSQILKTARKEFTLTRTDTEAPPRNQDARSRAAEPSAPAAAPKAAAEHAPVMGADTPRRAAEAPPSVPAQGTAAEHAPVADDDTGFRVQLGAIRSEAAALAEREAARLTRAHEDVLGALTVAAVRAEGADNAIVYRFRAGPLADRDAAETLCDALWTRGQVCLVIWPAPSTAARREATLTAAVDEATGSTTKAPGPPTASP